MHERWIVVGFIGALLTAPHEARADGGEGAIVIAGPLFALGPGSLDLALMSTGLMAAIESGRNARSEHPDRGWHTAALVLGGVNVAAGALFGAAVIDAAFKTINPCFCYDRNVFDNGLNPYALGLSITHMAIGIVDIAMGLWGLGHGAPPPVTLVPLVLRDGGNRLAGGIGVRVITF